MRHSKKRSQILNVFQETHELLTASQIIERLPHLDPATIYRNLNLFVQQRLIKELKITKGVSTYELNRDNHQHLVCTCCREVIPFDLDESGLQNKAQQSNFTPSHFEVTVYGLCKKCVE